MSKIHVGNLPFSATVEAVRAMFAKHGTVESIALPVDGATGRLRGFGVVEMSASDAARAIQNLNGKEIGGRNLKVSDAQRRPRIDGSITLD